MAEQAVDLLDSFAPYPGVGRGQRFEGKPAADTPDWFEAAGKPSTFPAAEPMPPWQANWPGAGETTPTAAAPAPPSDVSLGIARTAPTLPPTEPVVIEEDRATRARALARPALAALSGLPQRIEAQMAKSDALDQGRTATLVAEQEAIAPYLSRRAQQYDAALESIRAYRKGLESVFPTAPGLKGPPPVPDLKIRPWLDPEGKSAIQTIVQGLGAIATGVSGLVVGAPKTALAQFRGAAEAWRRDEVDTAAGRLAEFKATVETIRDENAQAVQVYDFAVQKRGANIEAARAQAITHLEELGLTDQAIQMASKPFEAIRKEYDDATKHSEVILKELGVLYGVEQRYAKAKGAVVPIKNQFELQGRITALQAALKGETDPQRITELQTDLHLAQTWLGQVKQDAKERTLDAVATRAASTIMQKVDTQLTALTSLEDQLHGMAESVRTAKPYLPTNPGYGYRLAAAARRQGQLPADAKKALGVIEQFYAMPVVTFERTVGDEKAARVAKAFGLPDNPLDINPDKFQEVLSYMAKRISAKRQVLELQRQMAQQMLPTLVMPSAPAEEPPPPEDEP